MADRNSPPEPDRRIQALIPAKDEEQSLGSVIREVSKYVSSILVVDGRSQDDTVAVARDAGAEVIDGSGRGKGADMRVGIARLTHEVTLLMDADGSHDPEDIPRLTEPILSGRVDHVSASRLLGGSSELHGSFDEWARLAGSAFITACINWRYGVRLSESQNGYRAVRTEVLKALRLRARHTTIEQEMIVETLRSGFRMDEVPSHEYPRRYGESHISIWRDSPRYVLSLARLML